MKTTRDSVPPAIRLKTLDGLIVGYVLAAVLMACMITWGIVDDARISIHNAQATAGEHARITSEVLSEEIGMYRAMAHALTEEHAALFEDLMHAPAPDDYLFPLAEVVERWFPRALAFTVTNDQGTPLITDFKGNIGAACLADLQHSAQTKTDLTPIHGMGGLPHFDIGIHITSPSGTQGIFLITFALESLNAHLTRHSNPNLVLNIISSDGQDSSAHAHLPGFVEFRVPNSEIVVQGHVKNAFIASVKQTMLQRLALYVGGFVLFALLVGWVLLRTRRQLRGDAHTLVALNDQLLHQSVTDALTGLGNRRDFEQRIRHVLDQARREHKSLVLALLDIDHFKAINDKLGHEAGDDCLRHLGGILRQFSRRPLDFAVRMGGEEFLVIWYDTTLDEARQLGQHIQHALREHSCKHADGHDVTLSIGMMQADNQMNVHDMLRCVDRMLYVAKEGGRDRIETHPPGACPLG